MTDTVGMEGYFTPEHAEDVFSELMVLRVELDLDPLSFGPKRLNSKVAEVRRMLDRCERIFLDIAHRLHRAKRALRLAETDLDLAQKNLFANDPETRAGRSVSDREAIAAGKLAAEVQIARNLMVTVGDLESVIQVVKTKRADLKDTEMRLKDQTKLCQEELVLGSRWGSSLPDSANAPDLDQGRGADEAKDLQEMLGQVDGEIHLAQARGEFPGEESGSEEEDEDGVEDSTSLSAEDSVDDIDVEDLLVPETATAAEVPVTDPAPILEEVPQQETADTTADPFDALVQDSVEPVLPGTAKAGDADDFLATVPMELPSASGKPDLDSRLALNDDQLLAMLSGFESSK